MRSGTFFMFESYTFTESGLWAFHTNFPWSKFSRRATLRLTQETLRPIRRGSNKYTLCSHKKLLDAQWTGWSSASENYFSSGHPPAYWLEILRLFLNRLC